VCVCPTKALQNDDLSRSQLHGCECVCAHKPKKILQNDYLSRDQDQTLAICLNRNYVSVKKSYVFGPSTSSLCL